jgi:hypothetical protein
VAQNPCLNVFQGLPLRVAVIFPAAAAAVDQPAVRSVQGLSANASTLPQPLEGYNTSDFAAAAAAANLTLPATAPVGLAAGATEARNASLLAFSRRAWCAGAAPDSLNGSALLVRLLTELNASNAAQSAAPASCASQDALLTAAALRDAWWTAMVDGDWIPRLAANQTQGLVLVTPTLARTWPGRNLDLDALLAPAPPSWYTRAAAAANTVTDDTHVSSHLLVRCGSLQSQGKKNHIK